ncbi:hypothetical protein [Amycolatopsis regifaucium]|uniref:Uncharacterized protein n=1 Tax=Amycolatopsis regifaucium TaxID=546365 RepID=A0A154MM21_9PSEU|nr:hypothetical protein [Amycolatopsis regifaucium]KZB85352.1 hypothetical protein AVL48_30785 [Amycolatopsis regifaucium]OKA09040.1 hypothetical protein ATP06_0210010 [Amycolatopsis regifaucium]
MITDRALTVKGAGLDMSFDAVYNGRAFDRGALGDFCTTSSGPDINLELWSNGIVFQDATGYCAWYADNGPAGAVPEEWPGRRRPLDADRPAGRQ